MNMESEDHALFDCIHLEEYPLAFVPPLHSDALLPLPGFFDDYNFMNIDQFEYFLHHNYYPPPPPFDGLPSFEEIDNYHDESISRAPGVHDMAVVDAVPTINSTTATTTMLPCYRQYHESDNYVNIYDYIYGHEDEKKVEERGMEVVNSNGGGRSTSKLSEMGLEEMKSYFYLPITRAAKEMNVGVTLLKKRCRELGILRWPHRKMRSLNTLIHNVQELGKGSDEQIIRMELESLEKHRKLMEENPELQLTERTKKLRQACFKANYKIRTRKALSMKHHYGHLN